MAQTKPKGLGKGLGALFGDLPPLQEEDRPVTMVPTRQIEPNPDQPRRSFPPEELDALADSLREHGVITPLTVRRRENGVYQIIAGERRWRAARQAGLQELPVYCLEADDRTAMELALIENLQRQDLNPIEEAQGYQSLMTDYGLTQEDAARVVGRSRPAVANALRLLNLSEPLRQLVREGTLSAGHARALLPLPAARQQELAAQVTERQLSVRQTEALVRRALQEDRPEPETPADPLRVDYVAECEKALSRRLGRGVKIVRGKRKGRFELEFYDEDDLQRLLTALERLELHRPEDRGPAPQHRSER